MFARLLTIGLIALLVTSINAQDKVPRELTAPTPEPTTIGEPAGQLVHPTPGIPLPTNIHQEGCHVYETPMYPQFKQCCKGGCSGGCCPKVGHCVSEVVNWLFYKPLPIPHHCSRCKHPISTCTPDVNDFFVQRYGYYNWRTHCPH